MNDDETIEYYQKRAGEYDQIYLRDNPVRQAELAAMYTLSQQALAGRQVLDLACGTGFWTRIVSATAASIVGIDINPATLAEAERKIYGCPVRFILADMFHLPFDRRRYDGLLATFILSHVRRQDVPSLAETVFRAVAPGSPVFLCDNNPITEATREIFWDDQHVNTYKKRRLEDGEEFTILKNYFERDELETVLAPWGRIEAVIYRDYYWAAVVTSPEKDRLR
jgi:demethylmenaquinone methyltransferase/2-methoxy-6-polyprenyl-1,4-benzoquinol methylase